MTVHIHDNDGPIRTPGPPQDLRADAGDGQVALSWLSPADTGAAAIQRYEYRHAKASEPYTLDWKTAAGGADARSVTVADLDNGTEYKFEVQAVNRFGAGKEAAVTATPAIPSLLAIGDVTVDEGDGTAVLEVTLTPASTETVTVDYATATATAGEDYTPANATLTFAVGVTSQQINIAITNDTDDEDAETFTVTLSVPINATIDDGTGEVTIEDDDERPGPPQDLSADPDDGAVTLSWSPPASSGSAAIIGYEYRYAEGSDAYADTWNDVLGGDAATEVTVGSLRNGTLHRFQVRAVSDVGGGEPAETTATPFPLPSLSIGDVSVAEGGGTAVLEVTLTPASVEAVTVDYATADATATAGEDYAATSGTLTFDAGETTTQISVSITDDTDDEDAETLTVTLSVPDNAVIGDGTGEVTIEDDDLTPGPPQNLSADPDDGMVTLSWSPPLTSGSTEITGYEYQYAEDSDAFADTWTEVLGGAGASEVTVGSLTNGIPHRFQVRAVNDVGGGEPAETMATPAVPPSLSIEDDDDAPGAPQDLSADPDDGRVALSWSAPSTSGSAAITGYEYRYAEGLDAYLDTWTEVSGGAGAREVTVGGLTNGTPHRFQVRAVNDVGGGEPAETTATPAPPPVLTIADVQVGEGDGTAVVEVTLTPASVELVTVSYAAANATATAGEDYTATNGTLTFEAGVTSREISVLITQDPTDEDDETFTVALGDATNAVIGDATGEVTIEDDDQAPSPPQDLSPEAGDSEVQLSWSPPADSGTAAITAYEYRYAEGSNAYTETWAEVSGGAAAREVTVGGLTNEIVHRLQVPAVSAGQRDGGGRQ